MVIFYAVVEDDPLDSGGYVVDGGKCGTIAGDDGKLRRITFVGQRAWCSTCESIGTIEAAPGAPNKKRLRDFTSAGRVQALSGDWVRCRCERPPRINSRYGRKWKIDEREPDTGISAAVAATSGTQATAPPAYNDRFVLRDAAGNPLSYTRYALQRDTGAFEYGTTDELGQTHLLASVPHAENITIYLAE
ncbi:PAAR domain-containing protein [Burkholderia sp. Ac-20353]|uniref:PAAR domain-containing protein n=1 Tax=Burkholderia sp. Ac-20353 TaxID=2703894 RepID=UPI00197C4550|nr:PAAR domain-containing protein [Burkholderia sp. Ac-20353]MBN3790064.1 PAAR domain-containing protein [Burkholderia sp. Ac-20353]